MVLPPSTEVKKYPLTGVPILEGSGLNSLSMYVLNLNTLATIEKSNLYSKS